jgi:HTTM domain
MTRAWNRFWFAPEPTSTLALFRIAFGAVALAWALSLMPDLAAFYSPNGIDPTQSGPGGYTAAVALTGGLAAAALCLIAGCRTRLASLIVFVGLISLERRSPAVFNSGDGLLRIMALFLALAPAGSSLSVDRWRTARDRFWEFPARAPWALRLMQVQLSVVYLGSVWEKLHGAPWTDGTAVSYAMQLQDFQRFAAPDLITHSMLVSSVMSYWTLAVELMIGILVWNRKARPVVLALGIGLHLGIDMTLRIGFFSAAILTAYIVFVSPAAAAAAVLAVRDRVRALTLARRVPRPA